MRSAEMRELGQSSFIENRSYEDMKKHHFWGTSTAFQPHYWYSCTLTPFASLMSLCLPDTAENYSGASWPRAPDTRVSFPILSFQHPDEKIYYYSQLLLLLIWGWKRDLKNFSAQRGPAWCLWVLRRLRCLGWYPAGLYSTNATFRFTW